MDIESEEAYKAVVRLGCGIGQGWYFGKPTSGEQARELLEARTRGPSETPLSAAANG